MAIDAHELTLNTFDGREGLPPIIGRVELFDQDYGLDYSYTDGTEDSFLNRVRNITNRFLLPVAGAAATVTFSLLSAHNPAHADGTPVSTGEPVATHVVDTPARIYIDPGGSIYDDLIGVGYTPKEAVRDIVVGHHMTPAQVKNPGMHAGDTYIPTKETIATREARLGIKASTSADKSFTTSDIKPDTVLRISKDPSLYKQIVRLGAASHATEILAANGETVDSIKKHHVGDLIIVPGRFLPDKSAHKTTPVETTEMRLPAGSSIYKEVEKLGLTDPQTATKQILKLSNLSVEEARKMGTGAPFLVPTDLIPTQLSKTPEAPTVASVKIVLKPGDTIMTVLHEAGSKHPLEDAKKVMAEPIVDNGDGTMRPMTPSEAAQLPVGAVINVPPTVALLPPPVDKQPIPAPISVSSQPQIEVLPNTTVAATPNGTASKHLDAVPAGSGEVVTAQKKVLFVGDSLTVGMNAGGLDKKGQEAGLNITSSDAVVGRSLTEALTGDINYDKVFSYDYIVLELGTNAKESDSVYEQNLRVYIGKIQSEATKRGVAMPQIFMLTLYEPPGNNRVHDETRNPELMQLKDELGIKIIDWAQHAAENPDLYAGGDGLHPSKHFDDMAQFVVDDINRQMDRMPTTNTVPTTTPISVPSTPEVIQRGGLIDILQANRADYANGKTDVGKLAAYAEANFEHPVPGNGISVDLANKIYKFPDRQIGFNYVTNPLTCANNAVGSPVLLAFVITLNDYAHYLAETDPRFMVHKGFQIELGDALSGAHSNVGGHGRGTAIDLRSRNMGNAPTQFPDGPLFMAGAKSFDKDFTEAVLNFAHQMTYNGEPILDHVETSSKPVEIDLTGGDYKNDWVALVEGHNDHAHFETEKGLSPGHGNPNPGRWSCEDPRTGGPTGALLEADFPYNFSTTVVKSALPTPSTLAVPVPVPAPDPTPAPISETAPTPTPPIEQPTPTDTAPAPPATPELENLAKNSPQQYIDTVMGGKVIEVQLRNSKHPVAAHADVQAMVDYVWRVEGGESPDVVIKAITVSDAESGMDNTAINKATGDECAFQINGVNRAFIDELNKREGRNIKYENLPNDLEGCVRVARALYKNAQGKHYSQKVLDYLTPLGLKLPPDLMSKVEDGAVSSGWMPWIMSARNHGLL